MDQLLPDDPGFDNSWDGFFTSPISSHWGREQLLGSHILNLGFAFQF
jgi:hypothetical protein